MRTINSIALTMAIPLLVFSCSSDEFVSENSGESITINVSAGSGSGSRAITTIDGYKLVCIMQLTSSTNNNISREQTDVTGETATFTILGTDIDNSGAENAIFWAEYQSTNGETNVYDSSDLTNIQYKKTSFDLTKGTEINACEAFAGSLPLADVKGSASVKLTRPMSLLHFKPSNPDAATGAEALTVSFETFSGINASNNKHQNYQKISLTNASFNPTAGDNWFDFFYFCPANATKLDKAIKMDLTGTGIKNYNYTINENTIPADANYIVNVTAQISPAATQDISVSISLEDSWNGQTLNPGTTTPTTPDDPTPPDEEDLPMEIGSYINAAGKVVSDKADAVGIVFHVGTLQAALFEGDATDAIENYPTKFNGKTIKGYAVAIDCVSGNFGSNIPKFDLSETITGYGNTATFITNLTGTPFVTAYNTWINSHTLNGNNISDWYIPSYAQLYEWLTMLLPVGGVQSSNTSQTFKEKFDYKKLFPTASVYYIACETRPDYGLKAFNITNTDNNYSTTSLNTLQIFRSAGGAGMCCPMITIFE